MNSNRNKSQNYSDIQAGQSLFDFLKRKKKFALETSLSKSRHKQNINNSNRDSSHQETVSPRKKYQDTYRQTLRQSAFVPSTLKGNQQTYRSSICGQLAATTPKKGYLIQEKQRKPVAKSSFIEMISPMKRKSANSVTPQSKITKKQTSKVKDIERLTNPNNPQQLFYRKNLNNSLSVLKSTLQKFISLSGTIKQKSHSVFVELKPILKLVQQSGNENFAKRAEQARLKLRTFQHLFKQFQIENGNEMIQQFHRSISQHLISLQSNLRSSFQKQNVQSYKSIREDKDNKIQSLQAEKQKLQKENQVLSRKIQKIQRQSQKIKLSSSSTLEKGEQSYSIKLKSLEDKIEQYEMENSTLAKQLDLAKQNQKELQKQVKDYKYLKQQAQRRFIEQNMKIKSSKQQFLLNQITIIKKQFKSDMEQLTTLYSAKQRQHISIIQQLRFQIMELHKQRTCDKEVQYKITGDASVMKGQIDKLKRQNQCLVTDLHRMNQELYQHWLALKDIKTLTVRLQIYSKFGKIYEDLAFNDQLFV